MRQRYEETRTASTARSSTRAHPASDPDGDALIEISRLFEAGTQVVYSEF
jgi:hypothetical protein